MEVITGDGGEHDPGPMDVIIVNAGVTHPRSLWLDRMRPVGRLLFPLTFDTGGGLGKGDMLLVKRDRAPYAARFFRFRDDLLVYQRSRSGRERRAKEAD